MLSIILYSTPWFYEDIGENSRYTSNNITVTSTILTAYVGSNVRLGAIYLLDNNNTTFERPEKSYVKSIPAQTLDRAFFLLMDQLWRYEGHLEHGSIQVYRSLLNGSIIMYYVPADTGDSTSFCGKTVVIVVSGSFRFREFDA